MTTIADRLRASGVSVLRGLAPAELAEIERRGGFTFPADFAAFLATGCPIGSWFPLWRHPGNPNAPLELVLKPVEAVLEDVRDYGWWLPKWGERPAGMQLAEQIAREHLLAAPRLLPVYGHLYLPAVPSTPTTPLFSVRGSDIIHAPSPLSSLLEHLVEAVRDDFYWHEFSGPIYSQEPDYVPLWSDIVAYRPRRPATSGR